MEETVHTRGFRQVDQTTDPQYYFQFLDEFGALESVQECRRLMFHLMDIHPGYRLLDAGCGVGDVVREMGRLVAEKGRVVGLDNSRIMIAEARKRSEGLGLPIEFIAGDAENLDFPSDSFDGCLSERTFMYLDARRALEEMIRVTKPAGSVVVFALDNDAISIDSDRRDLTRKIIQFHSDNHRNGLVGRQLARLFKEQRLTDITLKPQSLVCSFSIFKHLYTRLLISAEEAGVITKIEGEEWFNEMEAAERRGVFLFVEPGFIVGGRKPT